MRTIRIALSSLCVLAAAGAFGTSASADDYPVSGKWTYDSSSDEGPAPDCGQRYMSFDGDQRRDTGGGVPGYRNFSVQQNGLSSYNIVDEFDTGQISARANYTLRKVDDDRIELNLKPGGTVKLRRCE